MLSPEEVLTADELQQLAKVRDIILPDAGSIFPLALGWWLLIVLILITVIALLWWVYRRQRGVKALALAELHALSHDDVNQLAADISALLRRVARQRGDKHAITLSGKQWADYLSQKNQMPKALAVFFSQAPYARPEVQFSAQEICSGAEKWLRSNS